MKTKEQEQEDWNRLDALKRRIRDAGFDRKFSLYTSLHPRDRSVDGFVDEALAFIAAMVAEAAKHPGWYPRRNWVIEEDGFPRPRLDSEKGFDQLREEAEHERREDDDIAWSTRKDTPTTDSDFWGKLAAGKVAK